MTLSMQRTRPALTLVYLAIAACGGGDQPANTGGSGITEEDDEPRRRSGPGAEVSAEIGALDKDAVDKTFAKASKEMQACLKSGASRVPLIGGSVGFQLKIDQEGQVAEAHLQQSTIGDRETEVCMISALKKRSWPKPEGGKHGLAGNTSPFEFPMVNYEDRPPVDWAVSELNETLEGISAELTECRQGANGSFQITMYVDTEGQAVGVGVAPPDYASDSASDCLVKVLKEAKYPSPGSYAAKVSFEL